MLSGKMTPLVEAIKLHEEPWIPPLPGAPTVTWLDLDNPQGGQPRWFWVHLEGWLWARLRPHGLKFVFGIIFSSPSPAQTLLIAAHSPAPPVCQKSGVAFWPGCVGRLRALLGVSLAAECHHRAVERHRIRPRLTMAAMGRISTARAGLPCRPWPTGRISAARAGFPHRPWLAPPQIWLGWLPPPPLRCPPPPPLADLSPKSSSASFLCCCYSGPLRRLHRAGLHPHPLPPP
jgi:hypothetical protein